ncbi:uncharacterized protein LOC122274460 [Carya illinoinensis]|uniref:uncharacterized protein LOC122274460 n=1 Tax=Carya illinoinensis TaxID=32201 RepID=UPI001C7215B7|nr:uncharacterized protein LOC122274460 [Carya illinoinensis]
MAEDLARSWESLKLTDEEQEEIILSEEAVSLTAAKANKEAFKETMSKMWKIEGWVTFKDLGTNQFLIDMQLVSDKQKILKGRPWSFDRRLVCLKEFEGALTISEVQFQYEPFWFQIHNLPFAGMNKETGMLVGSGVGKILEVGVDIEGYGWGSFLRVKAKKLIPRRRFLKFGNKQYWLSFKYERLPMFCFKCGFFMHVNGSCRNRDSENITKAQYGQWLRASPFSPRGVFLKKYGGT